MASRIFEPLQVGNCLLQHRVVMAPLTRFRADDDHVPLPMVKEYYRQRASVPGTLLVTEGTFISPRAGGYNNVPGIWAADQIAAWKEITAAVHAKESFIFCQLWALGRTAQESVLAKAGCKVGSSSAKPLSTGGAVPEALTEEQIQEYIKEFAQAAKNAIEAGFDGVEIHGANGYLVDQFTQDVSNERTDAWGGSIEKRARFGIEVAKAVVAAIGPDKTGYRVSPFSTFQDMHMREPIPQFSALLRGLKDLKLAYIHAVESRISGNADIESTEKINFVLDIWGPTSPVLVAGGFKPDSAKRAVNEEYREHDVAVVFGRYFIANPDLPFRLEKGIDLDPYNRDTFYKAGSPDGYTDYPFSKEFLAVQS